MRPVASAEQVQDVLQHLLKMPPGTHSAYAMDRLIADGLLSSDLRRLDLKRARRLFQQRVSQWVRKAIRAGVFLDEHILFENKKGATTARDLGIEQAILDHLATVGAQSLRGVYYAMLGRGLVGHEKVDYQRLSALATAMREAGRLDADLIVDETTEYEGFTWGRGLIDHLDTLDDLDVDPWDDQSTRIEVWVEKSTLSQVLRETFLECRIRALPVHGNFHFGAAHQVAKRIAEHAQPVRALYLGDFDPTGLNIVGLDGSGVIQRRMAERLTALGADPDLFTIERIGLTADDVADPTLARLWVAVKDDAAAERRYRETGKGARKGDPNANAYKARYGRRCWEVDALIAADPDALRDRVAAAITTIRNADLWDESLQREAADQEWLTKRIDRLKADARRRSR